MNLKYFCLAVFTAVLPMFTACSDFERDKVDVIDMVSSDNVIFLRRLRLRIKIRPFKWKPMHRGK